MSPRSDRDGVYQPRDLGNGRRDVIACISPCLYCSLILFGPALPTSARRLCSQDVVTGRAPRLGMPFFRPVTTDLDILLGKIPAMGGGVAILKSPWPEVSVCFDPSQL